MDLSKFTQKSQEAVSEAQKKAISFGHSDVDVEHMAAALTEQTDGLVPRLLTKMDINPENLASQIHSELNRKPRLGGPGYDPTRIFLSQRLSRILIDAEKEAARLKDEYVSVEHLFLEIIKNAPNTPLAKIFSSVGLTRQNFMQALTSVRGSQRVTSATPEGSYEALERYGRDLVKAARDGKLDPVIGRDEEIRRVIRILSRKTKNNPVLIGEPGVGKTAIAEITDCP